MVYMSKSEQAFAILDAMTNSGHWWTRLKVARKLGYDNPKSTRKMLETLTNEGYLEKRWIDRAQGVGRYEYRVTEVGQEAFLLHKDGWEAF